MRPPSSVDIAILKPCPSAPSRFAAGTRQSWSAISTVSEARMPILSSCLPIENPGRSGVTMNAVIPRLPEAGSGSVRAKRTIAPACAPLVTQFFVPLST